MDALGTREDDRIRRAIGWSAAAHAALFAFVFLKSAFFPSEPKIFNPTLRVDLVGLPDLAKNELNRAKLIPPGLQQELEQAKQDAQDVKQAKAPEVKQEIAKPDELALNPKKAEKAAKPKEREKKISSALARIRALERIKTENAESEDEGIEIKGNVVSKGSSLSGDAKEATAVSYEERVKDRISEAWALPPYLQRQNFSAQIVIQIGPDGAIVAQRFRKTSGNPQFDDAVREALRDAQPLPAPPANLREQMLNGGILVGFPL